MIQTLKHTLIALLFTFVGGFAMADTYEANTDRPGYDFSNFDLVAERPIVCQWQCQKNKRCKAWTYVKPGFQGPTPRCWLKTRAPRAVPNKCCTSGIIQ